MKTFVLRDSREEPVEINRENFMERTREESPFVQDTADGRKYYATCPQCENPIQIRGLFHGEQKKCLIYQTTEYCPYSTKGKCLPKESRKALGDLNEKDRHVYAAVRDYYDLAVAFAEHEFGFAISMKKARYILKEYILSEGYLYPQNTVSNIPYMLLYLCKGFDPYGMWIKTDSALAKAVRSCRDLKLEDISSENGTYKRLGTNRYLTLTMMVSGHTCVEKNDRLSEHVEIRIAKDTGEGMGYPVWEDLVRVRIPVQEDGFTRFIHSSKVLESRDQKLLAMAEEIMPELPREV
jgi:hypothetical protein